MSMTNETSLLNAIMIFNPRVNHEIDKVEGDENGSFLSSN